LVNKPSTIEAETTKNPSIFMPKIFINYRREDTKSEARLLFQRLIATFPPADVVMDIDSIKPGDDFVKYLRGAVADCDVFLALVGPRWIESGDLHSPNDWVRIEIETALAQKKRIVPILVNKGSFPSADLIPAEIRDFANRNGLPLDSGLDFDLHMQRIVACISGKKDVIQDSMSRVILFNSSSGFTHPLTGTVEVEIDGGFLGKIKRKGYTETLLSRGPHKLNLRHSDGKYWEAAHTFNVEGSTTYIKVFAGLFATKFEIVGDLPPFFLQKFKRADGESR